MLLLHVAFALGATCPPRSAIERAANSGAALASRCDLSKKHNLVAAQKANNAIANTCTSLETRVSTNARVGAHLLHRHHTQRFERVHRNDMSADTIGSFISRAYDRSTPVMRLLTRAVRVADELYRRTPLRPLVDCTVAYTRWTMRKPWWTAAALRCYSLGLAAIIFPFRLVYELYAFILRHRWAFAKGMIILGGSAMALGYLASCTIPSAAVGHRVVGNVVYSSGANAASSTAASTATAASTEGAAAAARVSMPLLHSDGGGHETALGGSSSSCTTNNSNNNNSTSDTRSKGAIVLQNSAWLANMAFGAWISPFYGPWYTLKLVCQHHEAIGVYIAEHAFKWVRWLHRLLRDVLYPPWNLYMRPSIESLAAAYARGAAAFGRLLVEAFNLACLLPAASATFAGVVWSAGVSAFLVGLELARLGLADLAALLWSQF